MAVAVLAAASCAKEFVESDLAGGSSKVTFNLSLTETKTALDAGKTVWAQGDSILFSDGSKSEKVAIPAEFAGKSYAEVDVDCTKIDASDTIYAVYPPAAFKSAKAGVINLSISNDQSGNFDEANICVAMAKDYHFAMSNATSVMKFTVPEGVETVVLTAAAKDTLAGQLAVTCSTENPISVKTSSPLKSIKVATAGVDGSYYVAVVPGTYSDFTLMALSLDGKSQKKNAHGKTLALNDLADLGVIGDDMSGASLQGTGSEDDPIIISDMADMTTFATTVSNGLSYSGQFIKVTNDIEDISLPIGTFDQVAVPFMGSFDGQNHTLTLAMGGADVTEGYLGLFGSLGSGATVMNVIVSGTVQTKGDYVGGIAAYSNQTSKDPITIKNCKNTAEIKGKGYVGGILGYGKVSVEDTPVLVDNCSNSGEIKATGNNVGGLIGYMAGYSDGKRTSLTNSSNTGSVTGNNNVAGIVGRASFATLSGLHNQSSAAITATSTTVTAIYNAASKATISNTGSSASNFDYAVGGIAGFANNSSVSDSDNAAAVKGYLKVGGIVGGTYWCPVTSCNNVGSVEAEGYFYYKPDSQMGIGAGSLAGGIVGWLYTQGHITSCTNSGTVKGKGGIGGIVGYASSTSNSSSLPNISKCKNSGDVISEGAISGGNAGNNAATGGICGISASYTDKKPSFIECENTGNVSSNIQAVGGIVGRCSDGQDSGQALIDKCINSGSVTGTYWVSGILGVCSGRNRITLTLRNCVNSGTITGTRSDADRGVCSSGMMGGNTSNGGSGTKQSTTNIYNCYNVGDILYVTESFVNPYCGGIVGNITYGSVQNVYNSGFVGLATKGAAAEGAGAYLGQIAGCTAVTVQEAYYLDPALTENTAALAVGSASKGASTACVSSCTADGEFAETLSFKENDYSDLVSILNAWVAKSSKPANYYTWTAGPVFVK